MSNSGEQTTKQVPNPTGKGGFGDHPEHRNNGAWKKERTPRGRLEKLINDIGYDEAMKLFAELDSGKPAKDSKLGDVLDVAMLKDVFKKDPDTDAIEVSQDKLLKIYEFIYGRKLDSDVKLDTDEAVPIIQGFVLPIAPANFIDENGRQIDQNASSNSKQ